MREIAFMAWDGDQWVDDIIINQYGNHFQYNKCEFWGDDRPIELFQYTGLKDKNRVKIFDSHIVKVVTPKEAWWPNGKTDIYVVVYNKPKASFMLKKHGEKDERYWLNFSNNCEFNHLDPKDCEIIGHIKTQPELPKEGNQ